MFPLDIPPIIYSDPWDLPYADRLESLAAADCKVAYYYGQMPDSTAYRYRAYNMAQALNAGDNGVSASYFHFGELDKLPEIVNVADIIIICRARYCHRLGHAISMAKNKGKKLIFDVDDLVFDTRYVQLVLNTIGTDYTQDEVWQYWYGDFSRCGAVLSLCDKVITTNDYLADRIRDFSGKKVIVVPNFLNREQLDISEKLFRKKQESRFSGVDPVYLGYFSGTRTHNNDFGIVTDAVISLFKKYDNLNLRIAGLLDLDENLAAWSDRIKFQPLQDFVTLQKSIAEIDINLIPLQDNAFTNSKSELKFFEAGIVGTVSVATPTYVYANAIRDGENGFLANAHEWVEKLELLLDNKDDYARIAENAHRYAWQNYSWNNMGKVIAKAILG